MQTVSYARHQSPPDIIRHAVWRYLRFIIEMPRSWPSAGSTSPTRRPALGAQVRTRVRRNPLPSYIAAFEQGRRATSIEPSRLSSNIGGTSFTFCRAGFSWGPTAAANFGGIGRGLKRFCRGRPTSPTARHPHLRLANAYRP
jgi:hypothetical protein